MQGKINYLKKTLSNYQQYNIINNSTSIQYEE